MSTNKQKHIEYIESAGLSRVAELMTQRTGKEISAQRVNNWKYRGIPWPLKKPFSELSGIAESEL